MISVDATLPAASNQPEDGDKSNNKEVDEYDYRTIIHSRTLDRKPPAQTLSSEPLLRYRQGA